VSNPEEPTTRTLAAGAGRSAVDAHRARQRYRTNRLEAFSDGVFAIAITLLVLELSVPAVQDGDLLAGVLGAWPSFLAYVVSFASIGAVWLGHSLITEYLDHADATFLRLNLLLLLVVSFLPFPTRLLAEHIGAPDAERVATTLYGLTLLASALLVAALWRHAMRAGLLRAGIGDDDMELLSRRLTPGIAGYVALILLGLWQPTIAVIGFLLIALLFLIPLPRRVRR
jgi:uncharacterized membrane protein